MTETMTPTWRERAKVLGISLMKEPLGTGARKKAEVLADIEKAEESMSFAFEPDETKRTGVITFTGNDDFIVEPVEEHEPWQIGDSTPIEDLYRRIEALENRVNRLVDALSKSKRVRDI